MIFFPFQRYVKQLGISRRSSVSYTCASRNKSFQKSLPLEHLIQFRKCIEKTWHLIASPLPPKNILQSWRMRILVWRKKKEEKKSLARVEEGKKYSTLSPFLCHFGEREKVRKGKGKKFRFLSVQLRVDSVMVLLFVHANHFISFFPIYLFLSILSTIHTWTTTNYKYKYTDLPILESGRSTDREAVNITTILYLHDNKVYFYSSKVFLYLFLHWISSQRSSSTTTSSFFSLHHRFGQRLPRHSTTDVIRHEGILLVIPLDGLLMGSESFGFYIFKL